jgi:hypothetical protein
MAPKIKYGEHSLVLPPFVVFTLIDALNLLELNAAQYNTSGSGQSTDGKILNKVTIFVDLSRYCPCKYHK